MSDTATLLRRKLGPARSGSAPGASTVEAALRLSLPREADDVLSMDAFVTAVSQGRLDKAVLLAGVEPQDLVYLIEKDQYRGLCMVSPGLLAALTEMQMSGRISSTDPAERVPTRTDGIVAAHMIDRWMAAAIETLVEEGRRDALLFDGYLRQNIVLNRRNADLSIDPGTFRTLSIELSLGGGAKTGRLFFATPDEKLATSENAVQLRQHLPALEAPLRAVLARIPVSVELARKLRAGELLELPEECISKLQIEGLDGCKVVVGKLGQINGYRAVRLMASNAAARPANPALSAPAATAGEMPALPDAAGGLPDPSGLGTGGLPDLPAIDAGGGLPELPDLPAPSNTGGLPDLPDLPDLPSPSGSLPDLPDLPELPDLN